MALCLRRCFVASVFILQFITSSCSTDSTLTRTLSTVALCGNETKAPSDNLLHTTAVGKNDTLHYIFSTHGTPAVLVARTDNNATLHLNCTEFFSENVNESKSSIFFSHHHYAFAILFQRLLEYNDTDDLANIEKVSKKTPWIVHDLKSVPWMSVTEAGDLEKNQVVFKVNQEFPSMSFKDNGSLAIQMQVFGHEDRATELPHLEHNANITQLELVLDNINTNFTNARFALELTMVSMVHGREKTVLKDDITIDDEHTPGVFEMIDWTADDSSLGRSGFFQFKPVCYTQKMRTLNVATRAVYYTLHSPNVTVMTPDISLVYAYFGDMLYDGTLSVTMTNVSYGLSKDKFYTNTFYTVWTASIGYGPPPADQVSAMIIIILSVGLGLPIVLITFGGIGICIKKQAKKRVAYEDIRSDPVIN